MGSRRSWSVSLGSIAGIRIRLHLSFLLLILLVLASGGSSSASAYIWEFGWLVAVFVCVLLHELSHCVVARRYGIVVKDILLLPIGGVSEMESMPRDARQELAISAAGPLASAAIAAGALGLAIVMGGKIWPPALMTGSILGRIGWLNVVLAGFNLLPALPLDGGRVLRAGLTMKIGRSRATDVASTLGRMGGAALMAVGLFYDFWLVLIGGFVFLGATAEGRMQRVEAALSGIPVQAAMIWPAWTADEDDLLTPGPLRQACLRQGSLPVVSGGAYVGLVGLDQISADSSGEVAGLMVDRSAPAVGATDHLDAVVEALRSSRHPAVAVLNPDRTVVGMVRAVDLQPQVAAANGAGARS